MHLNDEQLLELDDDNEYHISQCEECNKRAKNLAKLRKELKNLPLKSLPDKNWQTLKQIYSTRNYKAEPMRGISSGKLWPVIGVSIAASALLMIFTPSIDIFGSKALSQNQQIVALIEKNNLLQQQLVDFMSAQDKEKIHGSLIRSQLSLIDQSIQHVHLKEGSSNELLQLWNQRCELMKEELSQQPNSHIIRI